MDDYARWFTAGEADAAGEASAASLPAEQRKQRKREEAERRNRLSPLRAEVARLETLLARLEQERTALETELAAPDIYAPGAKNRLQQLLQNLARVKRDLTEHEAAWLAAMERLDAESAGAC